MSTFASVVVELAMCDGEEEDVEIQAVIFKADGEDDNSVLLYDIQLHTIQFSYLDTVSFTYY